MNALLYALVVVIWGTTWIAIFLQQGPVAAPVSIFWRFAVASVTMLAILLVTRRLRPLGAKDHLCCLLQGCCVFCFNFWCFYTAAAWINTGLESVIFSMAVLFNAINSFLFFRQQPPGRFWAAAALGLAGIVILFWDDLLANGLNASLLWGIGLSALGTYGFSLGNMFSIRHQRRGLETLTTNSWAMLYGTLVMGAIALLRGDNFMPEWTVSYLGACFTWRCSARSSPLAPISLSWGASAPAKPPTVRCCFRWSPYPFPPSMKGMSGTATP
ncbi:Permease of the drug/metabolite transporter (DMT) superfamily [Klebsiella pneumoniae IS33]|nr:Permease of the drug/metabolite transporter (DMT) superfamily [Klebsiella pneumoniae IS33]